MDLQRIKSASIAALCLLMIFSLLSCTGGGELPAPGDGPPAVASAAEMMRSVMALSCKVKNEGGATLATSDGSAVILLLKENGDAYLLTNFHVVYDSYAGGEAVCTEIIASPVGAEGSLAVPATCVWFSRDYDLALLHISHLTDVFPAARAVEFETAREAVAGDAVFAVGNTRGLGVSFHAGTVSRAYDYVDLSPAYGTLPINLRLIRYDASVGKGDSGGGLFTAEGKLLGIVNARLADGGGGYAIPISVVCPIASKLLATAESAPRADYLYFGASLEEEISSVGFDEESAVLQTDCRVRVSSLAYGSISSAFLEKGDILLAVAVNGRKTAVSRKHHATEVWLGASAGDTVTVSYQRGEKLLEYTFVAAPSHIKTVL